MKRNMSFKVLDSLGLFVVVFGSEDPTDEEWLDYILFVDRSDFVRSAQLVVTDGGVPSFFHRRFLAEVMDDRLVPVAVVSSSARVRAVVRVMSVLNGRLRAFPSASLRDAFGYLGIDDRQAGAVEDVIAVLRRGIHTE